MLAFVIAARDIFQSIPGMSRGRSCQDAALRHSHRKRCSYLAHAPRSTEIQTIEMDDLWVCPVRDRGRIQQVMRFFACKLRQKRSKPDGKLIPAQDSTHQIGFDKAGREKIVAV